MLHMIILMECLPIYLSIYLSAYLPTGDGINDSTALAAAHVGLAMGVNGSAMAVTAAGVVLMNENLLMVPAAIKLCRYAKNAMVENCVFAICVKITAIVLAILGNDLSSSADLEKQHHHHYHHHYRYAVIW